LRRRLGGVIAAETDAETQAACERDGCRDGQRGQRAADRT
jgi:hypothetical protein